MMRRLIQNPMRRPPCRRKQLSMTAQQRNHPSPFTSISGRYSSGYEAIDWHGCQVDNDCDHTSTVVVRTNNILPSSTTYGFEIQGMSTRYLSAEGIQAISISHSSSQTASDDLIDLMRHTHSSNSTSSTTTEAEGDSDAFLELFKATSTSTLNDRQPDTDTDTLTTPEPVEISSTIPSLLLVDVENKNVGEIMDKSSEANNNSQEGEDTFATFIASTPETEDVSTSLLDAENDAREIMDKGSEANNNGQEGEDKPAAGAFATFITNQEGVSENNQPKVVVEEVSEKSVGDRLNLALQFLHHKGEIQRVMTLFNTSRDQFDDAQLLRIFHHVINHEVPASYEVLKYYAERCKAQGNGKLVPLDLYQRVVHRIRLVDKHRPVNSGPSPRHVHAVELQKLIQDITRHIQEEYAEGNKKVYQHILLPELVLAISEHRNTKVNRRAKPIMEYIAENDFPILDPELYKFMLSKGRRTDVGPEGLFPYHRVLAKLVSSGHRPDPDVVMTVLQCYHPFTDIDATHQVLSIIQKLRLEDDALGDYRIDLGTLESISMAAARRKLDVNLLVWDLADSFGYAPTESLFEDVIMSFASTRQDDNMFSALVDMEKNGFVPSQALLRYTAMKFSYHEKRLGHCHKLLTWHENEHMRSTHTMNALIMGYGMKRDINSAFYVFENFPRFNLQPDDTTFTFLMEALYVDTKDRFPYDAEEPLTKYNQDDIEDVIGAGNIILDAMDESGVTKTKHFYYEHVRLLCALGLLEDATAALEEAISAVTPVPRATLYHLANRYADIGNYEMAHAIAGMSVAAGCGEYPSLVNRINKMQRSSDHWKRSELEDNQADDK